MDDQRTNRKSGRLSSRAAIRILLWLAPLGMLVSLAVSHRLGSTREIVTGAIGCGILVLVIAGFEIHWVLKQ
jgi:hypothetical protein